MIIPLREHIIKNTPCAIYGNGTGGVCLYQMILCCAGKGLSP